MKVLIIGCGYVGVEAGQQLARLGHSVYGLRRSPEAAAELAAHNIQLLTADVTRPAQLEGLPSDWDWVINCAAAGGGTVESYRQVYLEGNRAVLAWLSARPPAKYVYTSSTGVYAQDDGSWVDETAETAPDAPTGRILVEAEDLLRAAARDRGFPAVILRVAGIYGPGRGYYLRQMLTGEARIEGTGGRFLNMIHRADVAGAIVAALERGTPGMVCNAVDNEPVTQRDLYAWLAEYLGKPMPPSVEEQPDPARRRAVTNKRVSNRRLREELGYALKFPTFREGYRDVVAF